MNKYLGLSFFLTSPDVIFQHSEMYNSTDLTFLLKSHHFFLTLSFEISKSV